MRVEPDRITLRTPDNWHAHFRDGPVLDVLAPLFPAAGWRGRIVAEPNLVPPVLSGAEALAYRDRISARAAGAFEPVPAIQITEATTAETVTDAVAAGVRIGKVYPFMVTTHSGDGVRDYAKIRPALAAAEAAGMVVQFHGEHPDETVEGLDKEGAFLPILDGIAAAFPRLRLTLEHITSRAAVGWIGAQREGVGASVTVHHLFYTVDDVLGYSRRSGGLMRVHCGCKPQPKWRADRAALAEAVLSGNPRFFYGGDDAAHLKRRKETAGAACGVWNTLVALPLLADFFAGRDALDRLEPFLSEFGARFYGYPLNEGTVTLVRQPCHVPAEVAVPGLDDSLVPMAAGETMAWTVLP